MRFLSLAIILLTACGGSPEVEWKPWMVPPEGGCVTAHRTRLNGSNDCEGLDAILLRSIDAFESELGWDKEKMIADLGGLVIQIQVNVDHETGSFVSKETGNYVQGEYACAYPVIRLPYSNWGGDGEFYSSITHELVHHFQRCKPEGHDGWVADGIYKAIAKVQEVK